MINWELARKNYPDIINSIQFWFNSMAGTQSKIWFYKQPIWRNELMQAYLGKVHKLKIAYDIAFDKKTNQFKFIYAIIDGDKAIPPQQVFSERIQAELFAYAHVLQYIKDKAAQIETATIIEPQPAPNE